MELSFQGTESHDPFHKGLNAQFPYYLCTDVYVHDWSSWYDYHWFPTELTQPVCSGGSQWHVQVYLFTQSFTHEQVRRSAYCGEVIVAANSQASLITCAAPCEDCTRVLHCAKTVHMFRIEWGQSLLPRGASSFPASPSSGGFRDIHWTYLAYIELRLRVRAT